MPTISPILVAAVAAIAILVITLGIAASGSSSGISARLDRYASGRKEQALRLREEAVALRRKVYGPEHPRTISHMGELARSYDDAGRVEDAQRLRDELAEIKARASGTQSPAAEE